MSYVKLPCGFEGEIDESAVNDMEFLDALTDLQEGDPTALSKMCSLLLSKSDKKRFYDACRNENGRAEPEKVSEEITELLKQLGNKKK